MNWCGWLQVYCSMSLCPFWWTTKCSLMTTDDTGTVRRYEETLKNQPTWATALKGEDND